MSELETERNGKARHLSLVFVFSFLLWLLLTASLAPEELIAGLLVALVAVALAAERPPILAGIRLTLSAPVHLLRYLGVFAVALVRANLDMARRVLSPSLPLRPAVVGVNTTLRSPLGKLALANSITLTPGTLAVDVEGDRLLVHWVDCPPGVDTEEATQAIAASFERHLKGFLR